MLSRFLIYLLLAVLPLLARAQESELKFARLSLEHGLSQNSITCMLRDHRGYLWIGTHDGLNRYDGYNFSRMKPATRPAWAITTSTVCTKIAKGYFG
jgi:ligand-binding sensor domain-containing protein